VLKKLEGCNNAENLSRYHNAKNETRKAISVAQSKAFEEFYKNLEKK